MISKASLLTKVPFIGPPVATALRQLESIVDVSTPQDFDLSGYPRGPGATQLLTCPINR